MEVVIRKDFRRDRGRRISRPRLNMEIRVSRCRLLGDDGTQYGIVDIHEARRIAQDMRMDLMEVSANTDPPVIKVIDYGKYKYNKQKKASENKKRQSTSILKEVQFRPNIESHDLETKLRRVMEFINQGDKVKLVMRFRGREMMNKQIGIDKFNSMIETIVNQDAIVESEVRMMGNRAITILAPGKKVLNRLKEKKRAKKD